MDQVTRVFIQSLLQDNERLERLAGLGFGMAACMQQLADGAGAGFGVLPLAPGLPLPVLEQIARDLATRVQPPEPSSNGNGTRVLVNAEKEQAD